MVSEQFLSHFHYQRWNTKWREEKEEEEEDGRMLLSFHFIMKKKEKQKQKELAHPSSSFYSFSHYTATATVMRILLNAAMQEIASRGRSVGWWACHPFYFDLFVFLVSCLFCSQPAQHVRDPSVTKCQVDDRHR